MVGEFDLKHCRICSGDIPLGAETCPLCSSHQQPEKRFCITGMIIALAAVGFIGIMLLGIMSAHAIQQIISTRADTWNAYAIKNINAAKVELDRYFERNGQFPETLDQIHFKPDEDVKLVFKKVTDRSYRLVSYHAQGGKEYLAVSGKKEIYCKERNQLGLRYVMVN